MTDGSSALDSKTTALALTIIILNIDDEQIIIDDININKEIIENQLIGTSIGNLRHKLSLYFDCIQSQNSLGTALD